MTQWFIIHETDAAMNLGKKYKMITTETEMSLEDIVKAIATYDRLRKNRSRPRRARFAETQEDLAYAYQCGKISRSTYYRKLKELGFPPKSPKEQIS